MIDLWKKMRPAMEFTRSRSFAVSMLMLVTACIIYQIGSMTKALYLVDGPNRTLHFVTGDVNAPLQEQSGAIQGGLLKAPQSVENVGQFRQVSSNNYFEATVMADGETMTLHVPNGTTVGEVLYENGIHYDGNDLLFPAAEKNVEDGDKIVLQRVEYEKYAKDTVIPFETVHKNSSLIPVGATKLLTRGEDGLMTTTYMHRTVDGKKEDVLVLGENVVKQPKTQTVLMGSVAPVSPLDFDIEVDENGKPLHYKEVLKDQVATGYSARPGAKTASGRYAVPGHVAVNPQRIPYGSKLYITTEDNGFIYGCAVAADTGIGLMADVVDVDLFYDTYQESVLNGRRIVDIYVLE